MNSRIHHICEENRRQTPIKYYVQNEQNKMWVWGVLSAPGTSRIINYCPYCGKKLELLDVKIEVSRKVLAIAIDSLAGIHMQVKSGCWTGLTARVDSLIDVFNDVLDD